MDAEYRDRRPPTALSLDNKRKIRVDSVIPVNGICGNGLFVHARTHNGIYKETPEYAHDQIFDWNIKYGGRPQCKAQAAKRESLKNHVQT